MAGFSFPRRRRFRTYLAALVLAATLPLLAGGSVAIWAEARTARTLAEERLLETAALVGYSVENELSSRAALLLGLGPDRPPPGVTDLAEPEADDSPPLLTVVDPISGASRSLPPDQLLSLAPQPAGSVLAAVVDASGRLVARSRDSERFVGRPVPDWATLQAIAEPYGLFEAVTAEGVPIVFAFQRLGNPNGWVVVIGEPLAAFNARWQRPAYRLFAVGAAALVAALFGAFWLSRRVLRPLRELARRSQAAASAVEDTPLAQTSDDDAIVTEFDTIRRRIEDAQTALRGRALAEKAAADAAARNELRYRTLAQVGAVVLWRADARGQVVEATGWQALTGLADSSALGRAWLRRVHPAERRLVCAALRAAAGAIDLECRLAAHTAPWHWVRLRGAVVRDARGGFVEWVGVLEDVHERRLAQERLDHLARHDALTGLPNRSALTGRLDAAAQRSRAGESAALLYLDLDRFKAVNDNLGHAAGDALLIAVAQRLRGLLRGSDIAVRLGGDEFVVLQRPLGHEQEAFALAERIVVTLGARYQIADHAVEVGVSVGVALTGQGEHTADELLRQADIALYHAKRAGRGCHRVYTPEPPA